jgi:hypothetical protein
MSSSAEVGTVSLVFIWHLVSEEKRRRPVHVEAGHTKPSEEGVSKAGLEVFQTGKELWGPPTL